MIAHDRPRALVAVCRSVVRAARPPCRFQDLQRHVGTKRASGKRTAAAAVQNLAVVG